MPPALHPRPRTRTRQRPRPDQRPGRRRVRRAWPLAAAALLAAWGLAACGASDGAAASPHDDAPVQILAAASLTEALEAVRPTLEAEAGRPVVMVFAASSTLARQVIAGADCDVYLSADAAWVDELGAAGFVTERRSLPANQMVVIVPARAEAATGVDPIARLRDPAVRRIAVADPSAVPAGRHARRALEHAEIWDEVRPRLVWAADVRQALAWVASGDADAGIVYATDAPLTDRVRSIGPLPDVPGHPVRGAAALMPHGAARPAARRVWAALAGDAVLATFVRFGFQPVPPDEVLIP